MYRSCVAAAMAAAVAIMPSVSRAKVAYEISLDLGAETDDGQLIRGYVAGNIDYHHNPPDGRYFTGTAAARDNGAPLGSGPPMNDVVFALHSRVTTHPGNEGKSTYWPCISQASASQGFRIYYPGCPDPEDLPESVTFTFSMDGGCSIDQDETGGHGALASLTVSDTYFENGTYEPMGWDGSCEYTSDSHDHYYVETGPGDGDVSANYELSVVVTIQLKDSNGNLLVQDGEGVGTLSAVTYVYHDGKEEHLTDIHGGVALSGVSTSPSQMQDKIHIQFDSEVGYGALRGDMDGDGDVDQSDYGEFAAAYDTEFPDPDYNPLADFDHDGDVDQADLGILLSNYGHQSC